jgi:two-component system chemotaxis sensor kinase CheA
MFADDMKEIVDSFVVETKEILEKLDNEILLIEKSPEDKDLVNSIFRAVHTVKGTSGFLSFDQMSIVAHRFEDVLNKLRRGDLKFQPSMMDVMLEAFDTMKILLKQVIDRDIQEIDLASTIKKLELLSSATVSEIADRRSESGVGSSVAGLQIKDQKEENTSAPKPEHKIISAETTELVQHEAAAVSQHSNQSQKIDKLTDTTIRVDVGRLDHLMNLVGELVLGRNRLSQIVTSAKDIAERSEGTGRVMDNSVGLHSEGEDFARQLNETSAQIDFITTELQTAVMKTRMVQIARVFNKFPRLVRDIAKEFSKEIDLIIQGEETELDKSIIEEISDPLVHLIRNAADHGVEPAEAREAFGKTRRGTIRLSAGHEGNHVIIQIEDDGAGMNPDKLKEKAIEKGMITPEEAQGMKTEDAYSLIFIPGFSMAQKVSNVSGRGVGMDVVKTNVTKLNGMIAVESAMGKGTKFTLKLPLTLAIIQGLLVEVGSETFAIPLGSVLEVVNTAREEVSTVHGREVIRLRESVLPLVDISEILNVPNCDRSSRSFYTVVVGVANHKFGIVVDRMIGQKEIVIKPLGAYLKNIPGIAGSTILGDGRVIMILDTGELFQLVQKDSKTAAASEVGA